MAERDFVQFVEAMDRCWLEHRFDDLRAFLADDVVIVAPGGETRVPGISATIGSYREFMSQSQVRRYCTVGPVITERGDTAVVEYRWDMLWSSEGVEHDDAGREVLVLARRGGNWRVVWRTQFAVQK